MTSANGFDGVVELVGLLTRGALKTYPNLICHPECPRFLRAEGPMHLLVGAGALAKCTGPSLGSPPLRGGLRCLNTTTVTGLTAFVDLRLKEHLAPAQNSSRSASRSPAPDHIRGVC